MFLARGRECAVAIICTGLAEFDLDVKFIEEQILALRHHLPGPIYDLPLSCNPTTNQYLFRLIYRVVSRAVDP